MPSLRLFGMPSLVHEGIQESLPLNTPSSLLFYLAVKGDWVSRSELAFLYKPDETETEALRYLRLQLHRAQQYPWASNLEIEKHQLRWFIETDVKGFRKAIEEQDWLFAIEVYKDSFFGKFSFKDLATYSAWIDLEREELSHACRLALGKQISIFESQGLFHKAAELSAHVIALDELDEQALQQHLRHLALSGQRDTALSCFANFSELLKHELDSQPLEKTLELISQIQAGELIAPAVIKELRHNLPNQSTRFIGRKRELRELQQQFSQPECRLLSLIGLGGSGKSRLSLEFARSQLQHFEDGVYFIELASVNSQDGMLSSLAQILGLKVQPEGIPKAQLLNYLRDKHMLLIFDNFEHLPAQAALFGDLLTASEKLKFIITSRERLNLSSEWIYDVEGLTPPELTLEASHDIDALAENEAIHLFVSAAKRVQPHLEVSLEDLRTIAQIVRQLEGLPLALELAASWIRIMPLSRIARELKQGYDLLETELSDVPERHRNLKNILDKTWQALSEKKRQALAKLSVFAGGCSLEAAEQVTGTHFTVLLSLVNEALLKRSVDGRLTPHLLVKQYAYQKLSQRELQHTHLDLCRFFANFFSQREQILNAQDEKSVLREINLDLPNLRLAWHIASDQGLLPYLQQLSECYYYVLDTLGNYQEGVSVFLEALENTQMLPGEQKKEEVLSHLKARAAYFTFRLGHPDKAKNLFEQSLQGDLSLSTRGFVHHYLGVLAYIAGEPKQAHNRYQSALEDYTRMNDRMALSRTQNNLGVLADALGQYKEAINWYQLALASAKAVSNSRGVAGALVNLGVALENLGRLDEAAQHYQESLIVYRDVGDVRGEAASLTNLGHLAERHQDYQSARDFYEKSIALKRKLGDPIITAISLANLGDVLCILGDTTSALSTLAEALRLSQQAAGTPYILRVLWSYAKFYAQQQNFEQAAYLAMVILNFSEAEVWVQQEATLTLETWRTNLPAKQFKDLKYRARHNTLESVCKELQAGFHLHH